MTHVQVKYRASSREQYKSIALNIGIKARKEGAYVTGAGYNEYTHLAIIGLDFTILGGGNAHAFARNLCIDEESIISVEVVSKYEGKSSDEKPLLN